MRVISIATLAAGLLVSACSDASRVDRPVVGRFSWFPFLGGEDIRNSCKPGSPARYRFVYNAVLDLQVRSYDLVRTETGATMQVRVPHSGFALIDYRGDAANRIDGVVRETALRVHRESIGEIIHQHSGQMKL